MLFSQLNGDRERPVQDAADIDVIQNVACEIGPAVDGIRAPRALPQSMGAFVTAGAQNACIGRGQQAEQHQPTTGFGLGQDLAPADSTVSPADRVTMRPSALTKLAMLQPDVTTLGPAPVSSTPSTYPVGTITAFSSRLNMWRVAIPNTTPVSGIGFFGLGAVLFTEVVPAVEPPVDAMRISEQEFDRKLGSAPFYKKPLFWIAVVGGTVAIGGGAFLLMRRRRRGTTTPARAAHFAAVLR